MAIGKTGNSPKTHQPPIEKKATATDLKGLDKGTPSSRPGWSPGAGASGSTLQQLSALAAKHDGTQASLDKMTGVLANARSMGPEERVAVKDALVDAFRGPGIPQAIQQFLRREWDGNF